MNCATALVLMTSLLAIVSSMLSVIGLQTSPYASRFRATWQDILKFVLASVGPSFLIAGFCAIPGVLPINDADRYTLVSLVILNGSMVGNSLMVAFSTVHMTRVALGQIEQ
jgi:hypothetical protein